MRLFRKPILWLWLALALASLRVGGAAAKDPVDAPLRQLAARAAKPETQRQLLRYAAAARDPEQRGLAYFVLGYREYEARQYPSAARALRQAAATGFSLWDFAEYYWAAAAKESGQAGEVIEALEGFRSGHGASFLRLRALELSARARLETNQAEQALEALAAEPRVRRIPSLALLLAQAYLKAEKPEEAARAFQEVYYAFPTAAESDVASDALRRLAAELGPNFPAVAEEIQTARVEIFFNKSQVAKALAEYESLLSAQPSSAWVERWKLGRARCLLSLKQIPQAIEALETREASAWTNPALDAERLATLVEAQGRRGELEPMLRALERLRQLYPQSPSYASALAWTASFFARRADWENALGYDRRLAEQFPSADTGRDANWRVTWACYLNRQDDQARQALLEHLTRYPTSPHVPAALYWLGRLSEDAKQAPDARSLYDLLDRRFAQSYYALLARRRPAAGPPAGLASDPALPPYLAALEFIVSHREAHAVEPCAPLETSDDLRPCVILQALGLDDLAADYLEGELRERPGATDLLLALGRQKSERRDHGAALECAKRLVPNPSEYHFHELPEEIWDLLFPQAYRRLVERQARAHRISPYLVMAVIRQESEFNPLATSWANARGLMQILPQTVGSTPRSRRLAARRLYEPAYNIRFGCRYLRDLLATYNGNLEQAVAAYHAGNPNVRMWLEGHQFRDPGEFVEAIPIPATRVYVESVVRDAEIYRQLMSGTAKFKKCG